MRGIWLVAALCLLGCPDSSSPPGDGSSDLPPRGDGLRFPDSGPGADLTGDSAVTADAASGQACTYPSYAGWRCLQMTITSARHQGTDFHVEARWNLPDQSPKASTLWVMGNTGAGSFRDELNGKPIQSKLALEQIRSVELEFTDPADGGGFTGGYFRAPRQGYIDAAWVYAEAVRKAKAMGIASGQWLTHVGISNGTMMGAAALAHHGLGQEVKRYVFLAGPFAAALGTECVDSSYFAFMGQVSAQAPDMRQLQDIWNGWEQQKFCQLGLASAVPSYDSRSLLGTAASRNYPGVSIAVLMGASDEFGPWILASNDNWYDLVTAGSKRRYLLDGVGHLVLGQSGQPIPSVVQLAIDTVYEHARRPPLQEPDKKPVMIFSKAPGGPAATSFTISDTLYGRVLNAGAQAQACMTAASNQGFCSKLANWTQMPNADWTFDPQSGEWTAAISLAVIGAGTYQGWWRNGVTRQLSDRAEIVVTP